MPTGWWLPWASVTVMMMMGCLLRQSHRKSERSRTYKSCVDVEEITVFCQRIKYDMTPHPPLHILKLVLLVLWLLAAKRRSKENEAEEFVPAGLSFLQFMYIASHPLLFLLVATILLLLLMMMSWAMMMMPLSTPPWICKHFHLYPPSTPKTPRYASQTHVNLCRK